MLLMFAVLEDDVVDTASEQRLIQLVQDNAIDVFACYVVLATVWASIFLLQPLANAGFAMKSIALTAFDNGSVQNR